MQDNQEGKKCNETRQFLFCSDDINLLNANIDTVNKTQTHH